MMNKLYEHDVIEDIEEVRKKLENIFLWPMSLKELNEAKEKKFEFASLDEVSVFENTAFDDKRLEKIRDELTLPQTVKLYCLYNGFSGLVETKLIREPFADIAGTIQIGYKSMPDCNERLIDGSGKPYDLRAGIPIYFTNFRNGYKGLPVKEKGMMINDTVK